MQIKDRLKRIKWLYAAKHFGENLIIDLASIPRLMKPKKKNSKIRVAFLCQYIPAWNKSEPVYRQLVEDEQFEVFLICIPSEISDHILDKKRKKINDTYDYYVEHGYPAINAVTGDGKWYDLKALNCDYVFYPRPYNSFMPEPYTARVVSKYSKICILLYAMSLTEATFETTLNTDFFRDVSIYFAETNYAAEQGKRKFWLTSLLGLRKNCFYGMPAMEQVLKDKEAHTDSWDFSKNSFRVMWTPRWTTDFKLGGSNFFVYNKLLLEYAKEHSDIDFLLRPHPLAFDNFIKNGEMTEQEVEEYKQQICHMDNVSLDKAQEYDATMWKSDVLISDISGIMPEYFVTGKPLIYCASNMLLELAEHTRRMVEGCYVANTPEEMFGYLEQLAQGQDPLYETRQQIIHELFGSSLMGASQRIVEELKK